MIAQVLRNERTPVLARVHRNFATSVVRLDGRNSHGASAGSHGRRFLQTSLSDDNNFSKPPSLTRWNLNFNPKKQEANKGKINILSDYTPSKWSSYSLPSKKVLEDQEQALQKEKNERKDKMAAAQEALDVKGESKPAKKRKRVLRPRKALITLTPKALSHLKSLLDQPEPKLIRIGVKNRGCSGLTYDLQYITQPGKFDEVVEQDGVRIIIDSKALFSVVGSEMDWVDDRLSSRFVFKNPNSKGTCGCGESFMV